MNKKTIMILGASILQLPAIRQAKKMGLRVVAVDMNPKAIGFKETGIEKEIISTIDIPKVLEAAKRHKIDGIMTLASDMPMRTVAAVASALGLVGIDEETARKATDKYLMRLALRECGVPVPRFYKVSSLEEFMGVTSCFSVPYIVKPSDNSGSRGISLVSDKSKAIEAFNYSKTNSRKGDVIVEEYMAGPEVSVETLTVHGVCHVIQITDKLTTGAPHFVEMGHSQPSCLDLCTQDKIKKAAVAANKAIGIRNGPSHTEIIVTNEGPKIVEIGARLGGDCITTHLVPLSTGVNMVECCIKIALGIEPDIAIKWQKGSAIRYFEQHEGIIKGVSGLRLAKKISGVEEIFFSGCSGQVVTNIDNSASRLGFVISSGIDAKNAIQICEKALKSVHIRY